MMRQIDIELQNPKFSGLMSGVDQGHRRHKMFSQLDIGRFFVVIV